MFVQWKINLYSLCFSQFLTMMATQLIIPFLPLYIKELGVKEVGAVTLWTGVIASSNFFTAMICSPFWGSLSDRYGRKLMVLRSTLGLAVFAALMASATNVYQLFALRTLMGAFSGFSAAAIAMAATNTPEEQLGFSMGLLQTSMIAGSVMGPLFGGGAASLWGFRQTFLLASLLNVLAFIQTLILVKEDFQPVLNPARGLIVADIRWAFSEKRLLTILVVTVLMQFAVKSVEPLLTIFIGGFYHQQESLSLVAGMLFAVVGVGTVISSPVLGRLSDRRGTKRILMLALIGAGGTYFVEGMTSNVWLFGGLQMMLGISLAGMSPICNTMVGHLVPREKRGAAFGLMGSANSLGWFLGPLSSGIIATAFGLQSMFFLAAGMLALSALVVNRMLFDDRNYSGTETVVRL